MITQKKFRLIKMVLFASNIIFSRPIEGAKKWHQSVEKIHQNEKYLFDGVVSNFLFKTDSI